MRYLLANGPEVWRLTLEHVTIAGLACLLASAIACPLGAAVSRARQLATPVLGAASVLYTIPSLALFALLIPFLGLGVKPAVVALVLYAQLVLIRNTAAGLTGVDPAILEAAEGMGMTGAQRFWRVEVPLAIPVVFAAFRTTAAMAIGLASIAAYIGAGGLGVLIFQGIATGHTDQVLAGTVAVSALALAADGALALLGGALRRAFGVRE